MTTTIVTPLGFPAAVDASTLGLTKAALPKVQSVRWRDSNHIFPRFQLLPHYSHMVAAASLGPIDGYQYMLDIAAM